MRERDEEFAAFVRARSAALLRTAYALTGDRGHAEDLLQTALIKTYLAWGRIAEPQAVEAYVRRTLVTTSTSWWRRRWHGERATENLPEVTAPDTSVQTDDRELLWLALASLPARQRAVAVLRFYEDLSEAETARLLGCSVGTVKSQSARALARLRVALGEEPVRTRDGGTP